MPTRDLLALDPELRILASRFLYDCEKQGIKVSIYCTYRSLEEQAVEYAKGRTAPGKKVTNARPGMSWHNYRLAFDCVPLVNGKAEWNDKELWTTVGEIGEAIGLEWGGRFTAVDCPHFQLTKGKTIQQMRELYGNANTKSGINNS
jgi:peptidoglycan L-alanyl-D-glutamate endopeptidase CwlK